MTNMDEKKFLTAGKMAVVVDLFSSMTHNEIARKHHISLSTLSKWLRDPLFQEALRDARRDAISKIGLAMAGLAEKSIVALSDALEPGQKMSYRLRAAEIVTDRLIRLEELAARYQPGETDANVTVEFADGNDWRNV